jgi:hypothetical protein
VKLAQIRDLAWRFVPAEAADSRLFEYTARSFWPAHEIGHFLVATRAECRAYRFDLDGTVRTGTAKYRYAISREIAAMSISQRLLRRAGHGKLADEEIEYTDETTLECSYERWCKHEVAKLLRVNHAQRLPRTFEGLELLLSRKARAVKTEAYASRKAALAADYMPIQAVVLSLLRAA